MGSVTCERCGFVSFATSEVCKQCGGALPGPAAAFNWRPPQQPQPNWQPAAAPDWQQQQQAPGNNWQSSHAQGWPPPPHGGSDNYQSQPGYYAADDGQPKRKGMAVVALLCGLLALPVLIVGALAAIPLGAPAALLGGSLCLVMTILALTLGVAGTVRANRNPAEFGGKGMAVAGIVLGSLLILSIVPIGIISAIAIPNLLAARRAANEASAIQTLRTIGEAQATYRTTAGNEREYASSTEELIKHNLLDPRYADGTMSRYRFEIEETDDGFQATATPVDYPASGIRSFYTSEDGVIHGADKGGAAADEDDPTIGSDGYAAEDGEEKVWADDGRAVRRTSLRPDSRR